MTIKAVMCDVDGTMLTSKQIASEKTIQVIRELRNKGILFGLCTGRDVSSVLTRQKDWHIDGLIDAIIGSGGAEIYDAALSIRKETYSLDKKHILEIMAHYEDMNVNFAIPMNGVLYTPKDDENIRMLSSYDHEPYKVVDFDSFLDEPRLKIMIVCHPDYMRNVIERSKTFHSEHFRSASLITSRTLYEYMDPRVTKSNGLKGWVKLHGWTMDEICTFGDADNDYDMTLHAGVGVVMRNGSEKSKSVADYITDDNEHDGIANFLHQHPELF